MHQKTHYSPPLEALKYAHSETDFTLCAGGVHEVNYPFNESMANKVTARKPISLFPSSPWGQNRAQSIIEMFNNPNLRSFHFVPCTDNKYEQAKENNLPTMQKDVDVFLPVLSSTPHNVKRVVALVMTDAFWPISCSSITRTESKSLHPSSKMSRSTAMCT